MRRRAETGLPKARLRSGSRGAMEGAESQDGSYQCTTNWTVASGSLKSSIALESSLSEISGVRLEEAAVPARVSPLVLCAPSDTAPCEIKITFSQKHELRQVYVRSTALTYEIYYGAKQQECDEYLCTVRCGIATRDAEVLVTNVISEACSPDPGEPTRCSDETTLKVDFRVGSNEDGWVELKIIADSGLNDGRNSPASNSSLNPDGSIQDLYEATAEINDVEPCISLTLRLLSLQDKGCVVVDEVYVFADPVDLSESDQNVGSFESSLTSSLMAMHVPNLMQLPRARDASRGKPAAESEKMAQESYEPKDDNSSKEDTFSTMREIQDEEISNTADEHKENLTPHQVPSLEREADPTSERAKSVLDQLVSRVGHIEEILTRFETSMLKPINSIDERLRLVELKLDALTEKPQSFSLPNCTRIVAPEFSCNESDPFSTNGAEVKASNSVTSEYNEEDSSRRNSCGDVIDLDTASHSTGVPVAADCEPQSVDDEKENHSQDRMHSEEKPKHSVSMNDAFASALTGFMSLAEDHKFTKALAVRAPEFSIEDDDCIDMKAYADHSAEESMVPPAETDATNTNYNTGDLNNSFISSPAENEAASNKHSSSMANEAEVLESIESHSESKVDEYDENFEKNVLVPDNADSSAQPRVHVADSDYVSGSSESRESDCRKRNDFVLDEADFSDRSPGGAIDATPDTMQKESQSPVSSHTITAATDGSKDDVQQSVLKFSRTSSSVDSKVPILDVKYNSDVNSGYGSSIDALLGGSALIHTGTTVEHDRNTTEQHNLIRVEDDEKLRGPPTDTLSSLDVDYYEVNGTCHKIGAAIDHGCGSSKYEQINSSSLI